MLVLNATSIWRDYDIDVSGRIEAIDGWKLDTLFTEIENEKKFAAAPLAVRMRPRSLGELAGQEDVVGPGSWLHAAIEADTLSVHHFVRTCRYGQNEHRAHHRRNDARDVCGSFCHRRYRRRFAPRNRCGRKAPAGHGRPHRFCSWMRSIVSVAASKTRFLHAVENRTVVLVGATTENPFLK